MRKTVIIAENHSLVRQWLVELVNGYNPIVIDVDSGEELLVKAEELRSAGSAPALTLCDVEMRRNKIDGISACERFRKIFPKAPFFAMSTKDREVYAERALKAGATDYLDKKAVGRFEEIFGEHLR